MINALMTLSRQVMLLSVVFSLCSGEANAQVRLSPEAAEKLLVEQKEAVYPASAQQIRAEGLARIQITVSDQGVVAAGAAAEIEEIKKLQKTLP